MDGRLPFQFLQLLPFGLGAIAPLRRRVTAPVTW